MNHSAALLFLHAQTSLHPGTGTALGTVDLPIQRERHTGWPTIAGSSLKGVLRDASREKIAARVPDQDPEQLQDGTPRGWSRRKRADHEKQLTVAFGPPTDGADKHSGAVSVTDARILAFPVRSLKGVFGWLTCPGVLCRLSRDMQLANGSGFPAIPTELRSGQAQCAKDSPLRVDGKKLVFEEFDFDCVDDDGAVAAWFEKNKVGDDFARKRLTIVADDDFTYFVRHATEVVARIALNYETKTAAGTALFYQEFLPAETFFYALVLASGSRHEPTQAGEQVLSFVRENIPPVLQIGGDETTGKGICLTALVDGKDGER